MFQNPWYGGEPPTDNPGAPSSNGSPFQARKASRSPSPVVHPRSSHLHTHFSHLNSSHDISSSSLQTTSSSSANSSPALPPRSSRININNNNNNNVSGYMHLFRKSPSSSPKLPRSNQLSSSPKNNSSSLLSSSPRLSHTLGRLASTKRSFLFGNGSLPNGSLLSKVKKPVTDHDEQQSECDSLSSSPVPQVNRPTFGNSTFHVQSFQSPQRTRKAANVDQSRSSNFDPSRSSNFDLDRSVTEDDASEFLDISYSFEDNNLRGSETGTPASSNHSRPGICDTPPLTPPLHVLQELLDQLQLQLRPGWTVHCTTDGRFFYCK